MELRVRHADGQIQRIVLDAGRPLRFGSHKSADVKLREADVLPVAFGIVFHKGVFQIVPSKSAGSVPVNGQQVKKARLQPGDVVQLGKTRIDVVGDAATQAEEVSQALPPDILADDILGADAGLPPLNSPSDSLLMDSIPDLEGVADPFAELPSEPDDAELQPDAQGRPAAARKTRQRRATSHGEPSAVARVVQSGWFKVALTSVIVVPLVVLIAVFLWQLPSDQQAFDAADDLYHSGDWNAAARAFDKFLAWNDESALAGEAAVKRDLAQLRLALEQGHDASRLLADSQAAIERWGASRRQAAAEEGLAEVLPPLVADLTRAGQNAAERSAPDVANASFAEARIALDLIYQFVPPRLQEQQSVDQLLTQLTGLEREFNQPAILRQAVERIESVATDGGIEAAYAQRNALLAEHPELVTNGRLVASMRAAARAEAARVAFETAAAGQAADEPETRWDSAVETQILFSPQLNSKAENAVPGSVATVSAPASGAVFGLDVATLDVLWRYHVGATDTVPVHCSDDRGRGVLLADRRNEQLVRVDCESGQVVWHCPIPQFVGQPQLAGDHVVVATADGQLVEMDVARGIVTNKCQLAQALPCEPVLIGAGEELVQVGSHSLAYLISRKDRRCLHVHYLGHEVGGVTLPPVIGDEHVFVVETVGSQKSEVHVLRLGDQLQAVASFAVEGLVTTAPVFLRGSLYVPTSVGQLHVIRHFPEDSRRPFRLSGSVPITDDAAGFDRPTFLAVMAGRIWAGGDGLTVFEPTSSESAPLRRTRLDSTLRITQPLQVFSSPDSVVCSGTASGRGIQVRRWDARAQTAGASSTLAVPAAARPLVSNDRQRLWNLAADGTLYEVKWRSVVDGVTSNWPAENATPLDDQRAPVEFFPIPTVGSDYGAFATNADRGEMLFVPLAEGSPLRRVDVALPLAGPAVPLGDFWMVPFRHGAIALLNPDAADLLPEVFLPVAKPNEPLEWSLPLVTHGQRAVVYDGHHRLFAIRHGSGLQKLELELETSVESPLRGQPVLVGPRIWGVNQLRQFVAFNSLSLQVEAAIALPADVNWGPVAVGKLALLAIDDGTLICVGDAAEPLWQVKDGYGPIVGVCLETAGEVVVASQSGVVWRLRADSGAPVGAAMELMQPLAFGPLVFGDRLAVVSADGTLLLLRNSADEDEQE